MLRHRPLAILIRVTGLANLGGGIPALDKELRVFFGGFVRRLLRFLSARGRGLSNLSVGPAFKQVIVGYCRHRREDERQRHTDSQQTDPPRRSSALTVDPFAWLPSNHFRM